MKITLITICFNSAATIADTVQSVLNQDYENLEYLVIDGGSSDNTMQVLNNYRNKINALISEPDLGLYAALNKGLSLASGDVIGFIHADDFFPDNKVISDIAASFGAGIDAVYGDLDYVDDQDKTKVIRKWRSGKYKPGSFAAGWMLPHPTFYVRKEVYDRLGGFNLLLKSSADYELMLRFIHKNNVTLKYLPRVLVKMRVGGMSNVSADARKQAFKEDLMSWEMNGMDKNVGAVILKKIRKLRQWL